MAKKIMLIDDTRVLAESIADTLYMEGYNVSVFNTATEALPTLEESIPDLVITDMIMPEMDGLAFTRCLRNLDLSVHIPVIIMTADANPENEVKAREAGADLLLHKPFNYEALMAALKNFLYD